jgi:fructose-bisphosphate aldolase class II
MFWILFKCQLIISYDMTAAIGLVRAAERQKSPAILQLFPITVKYGGGPFLQMCLDL